MNYRVLTIPVVIIALSIAYTFKTPETSAQLEINNPNTIEQINANKPVGDTSEVSLDWNGSYKGVLPCADCEGIAKSIVLNNDKTYTMTTEYLGKQQSKSSTQGTFTWNNAGNTITLSNINNEPSQYFVGENMLIQLDMKGNRIKGDLADKYILSKQLPSDNQLTNVRWQLVEIMGQKVTKEDIYIQFSDENGINGYDGCNLFNGSYETETGNQINVSQMMSTMRACPELEKMGNLMATLQKADNYAIKDGVLSLNKARMAPLLRFKATPIQ